MMTRIKYTLYVVALAILAAGAGWGYMQLMEVRLSGIEVRGARWTTVTDVEDLLLVDTTVTLFHLDPALLADRVERHAWVARASVARLPSGLLLVDIVEREPVALLLSAEGVPIHYVDRNGYRMPLQKHADYNVPLVRGLEEAYHPMVPVAHATLRDLLFELPVRSDVLLSGISEIIIDGPDVSLWIVRGSTSAAGSPVAPVRVALGDRPMKRRFDVLEAFLEQEAWHRPEITMEQVDLRFENQIVVGPKTRVATYSSR